MMIFTNEKGSGINGGCNAPRKPEYLHQVCRYISPYACVEMHDIAVVDDRSFMAGQNRLIWVAADSVKGNHAIIQNAYRELYDDQ